MDESVDRLTGMLPEPQAHLEGVEGQVGAQARRARSARRLRDSCQPTTRRECTPMTKAAYT